jgi:hypothetical protein
VVVEKTRARVFAIVARAVSRLVKDLIDDRRRACFVVVDRVNTESTSTRFFRERARRARATSR